MSGFGRQTFVSGEKYEGEYLNNFRNGYGIYTWPNGAKYEGRFVNNSRCQFHQHYTYKFFVQTLFSLVTYT